MSNFTESDQAKLDLFRLKWIKSSLDLKYVFQIGFKFGVLTRIVSS